MAVLFLFNIIFSIIALISDLLSRLLFNVTAFLIVLVIQALKLPGEALQSSMEQIAGFIRSCIEYALEIIVDMTSAVVGFVFYFVKEGVSGSVVATGALAGGLGAVAGGLRSVFDGLTEEIPAIVKGAVEMVTTMVTDFWNNYIAAQSYVKENA